MNYRDVFGEILADHHESPRNWGFLENPSFREQGYNPVCGDQVTLTGRLEGKGSECRLSQIMFEGEGCSICMASASIMSEMVQGQSLAQALRLIEAFRGLMQGQEGVPEMPAEDSGQDIAALYGVRRFPVRIKCALLPWTTLKKGLEGSHEG